VLSFSHYTSYQEFSITKLRLKVATKEKRRRRRRRRTKHSKKNTERWSVYEIKREEEQQA